MGNTKKIVLGLVAITVICLGSGYSILAYKGAFSRNNRPMGLDMNIGFTNKNASSTIAFGSGETFNINEEKTVSLNNTKDLTVNIPVGNINFIPEKRNDIKANLHGSVVAEKSYVKPELSAKSNGNEVIVMVENQSHFATQSINLTLDIYIPSDYSQNIKAASSVGNIAIGDMKLNKLDLTSSTGDIKIKKLKLGELSLRCTTGDIRGESIESTKSKFNCITGSVKLDGALGSLTGKVTTGDANISYASFDNDVDISAITGSIKLHIPKDSKFNMKSKASIGSLSCSFPLKVTRSVTGAEAEGTVESDKNHINLSVTTGDIVVSN